MIGPGKQPHDSPLLSTKLANTDRLYQLTVLSERLTDAREEPSARLTAEAPHGRPRAASCSLGQIVNTGKE